MAIVHDYLTQRGGAERVVLSMTRAFPGAQVYTSMYAPDHTYPEFREIPVTATYLNRVGALRRDHRRAFPLLPHAMASLAVSGVDVVLCSSSGWAHGVRTEQPRVVYCYSPARWLYKSGEYGTSRLRKVAAKSLMPVMRRWDLRAARGATRYVTLSNSVRDLIREVYGIEAEVLRPPVLVDTTGPRSNDAGTEAGFYLCIARMLAYKNVGATCEAFRELPGRRLIIVGAGPLLQKLERSLPPNVRIESEVSDDRLRWLYDNCAAVVSASFEDYGLTPVEGLAFGKPSVVLRFGGFLDTVREDETGTYFDTPEPSAIRRAIQAHEATVFDPGVLADHAQLFSEARFAARLREIVHGASNL